MHSDYNFSVQNIPQDRPGVINLTLEFQLFGYVEFKQQTTVNETAKAKKTWIFVNTAGVKDLKDGRVNWRG